MKGFIDFWFDEITGRTDGGCAHELCVEDKVELKCNLVTPPRRPAARYRC